MAAKYIYLDQNQWIYLARDYWGRPTKPEHAGIANRFLGLVNSDEVRLPLSTIHFIEHLSAADPGRRYRLAEVFEQFGRSWHIASWSLILVDEVSRAVTQTFGRPQLTRPLQAFGRGYLFGLSPAEQGLIFKGRSTRQVEFLEECASLPGAILDLLTFPNESGRQKQNAKIHELGQKNALAVESFRKVKRPESVDTQRRAQYAGYTLDHQDLLIHALAEIGHTLNDFLGLGVEELTRFWASVPTLDVDCELSLYRDKQWTRRVSNNDVRDLGQLAVAVPYCDVVVTERFWTRAADETGISNKYGTLVCSNLIDVIDLFE